MAEETPLLPSDNSPFSHKRGINDLLSCLDHHASARSSDTPLPLAPPPSLELKPKPSTEHQQQTHQSPKKAKFLQVSEKFVDEVGTSYSSENFVLQGEYTKFQCETEKLDVGFVQKEVIDEFLGIKDEVGEILKDNSSEPVNLSQTDGDSKIVELGFEKRGENFEGFLQNLATSEDLTSCLNIDVINDTAVVDVLKVEGKRIRRRGKKGSLKNTGFAGVGNSNVGKRKGVYSRKEMEALRYVNVKAQKKFWQEIYDSFSMIVKKEYDELGSFRHKKHGGSISGQNQSGGKRNCNNGGIMGESCMDRAEDSVCCLKSDCDVDKGHNDEENGGDLVEWSEDEESDDEYDDIQRPAFKVDGEPDFESGPPEDGLEYLRRVRWEAKQIPKIKIAKLDNIKVKDQSVYMPIIPDIKECPPHLAPMKIWEDEFITDFSNLRLALSHLEDSNSAGSVDSEPVIGSCEPKSHPLKNTESLELATSRGPMISTVLEMDPVTRVAMLRKRISLFETSHDLSKDECGWLFALCAVVGTPLDADTCASLRCLLRRCANMLSEKTEVDDDVAMLNVLATLAGRFFGQKKSELLG